MSTSLAPLLEAEVGLSQLTSVLRSVTKRKGEAADTVKDALAQLRSVEMQARCLGLTLDTVHCVRPGQSSTYVSGNNHPCFNMLYWTYLNGVDEYKRPFLKKL